MSTGYDLGGFTLTKSNQQTIIMIFIIYSVAIILLGLYANYSKRTETGGKMAAFLTGGGNLNSFEIAMISTTNLCAGGVMLAAPGLTYAVGFVYGMCVYSGFLSSFASLWAVGRKSAIVRNRVKATTFVQLMRHRFQSKAVALVLAIGAFIFLTVYASAQITSGAKMFAAITGTNSYTWGIIIITVIAVIYTMTGGIKSLAKVAVLQGIVMLLAVLAVFIVQRVAIVEKYGSIKASMDFIASTKPSLLQATAWTPMYTFGTMLLMSWVLSALPHGLSVTMTYNNPKSFVRAVIIGTISFIMLQGIMSGVGPLNYALNQGIKVADYNTIYIASNLFPAWLGGVLICGATAAIQSTIAGLVMAAAASIAKDVYKDILKVDAADSTVSKINLVLIAVCGLAAILIAAFPTQYTQLLINFSLGGLAAAWLMPVLFGLYSRTATAAACAWSSVCGMLTYLGTFLIQTYNKPLWMAIANNAQPVVPAVLVSLIVMIVVSKFTKRVPLGIYQVWFGKDYDEKFATLYDLK